MVLEPRRDGLVGDAQVRIVGERGHDGCTPKSLTHRPSSVCQREDMPSPKDKGGRGARMGTGTEEALLAGPELRVAGSSGACGAVAAGILLVIGVGCGWL